MNIRTIRCGVLALTLLPKEPGEYEFACQMGMFRGKIIVE